MSIAEKILKADDRPKLVKVKVPEWGVVIYVKVMDGAQRDQWELAVSKDVDNPGTANIRAKLAIATVCDENGKLIFTTSQAANLGKKSSIALDRIYTAAKDLNKLSDQDIEDLEKN